MTVIDDTKSAAPASITEAQPLVAKKPPKYAMGQVVVLKGYEDGWRWTVTDAGLLRRRNPFWNYTLMAFRPYDGKLVFSQWPEWRIRPVPNEADI